MESNETINDDEGNKEPQEKPLTLTDKLGIIAADGVKVTAVSAVMAYLNLTNGCTKIPEKAGIVISDPTGLYAAVGVAVMANGSRVGCTPARLSFAFHTLTNRLVAPRRLGEVPGFDVFLFQDGRSIRAMNLDSFECARKGRSRGFDDSQSAVLEAKRGHRYVFHFDAFVSKGGCLRGDLFYRAHQPDQQIDAVNGLVH